MENIEQILKSHADWLNNHPDGERANLRDADLSGANLRDANLTDADLRCANMIDANLRDANLRGADLTGANLSGANLSGADLSYADLTGANLSGANLIDANLIDANLSGANLRGADLRCANLRDANLRDANLSDANLSGAELINANLSGADGLLDPEYWIGQFETTPDGVIVYKKIGRTAYRCPADWEISPGAVLTEVCNPCRTVDCGSGVNFGTEAWCRNNYNEATLWRCLIRWAWLPGVVVPYNTDGKARCARLQLLEPIDM